MYVPPLEAAGNVTTQMINDQMQVLNDSYAGTTGGAATRFTFVLAGTDTTTWREVLRLSEVLDRVGDAVQSRVTPDGESPHSPAAPANCESGCQRPSREQS